MKTALKKFVTTLGVLALMGTSAIAATMDYLGAWSGTTTYATGKVVVYNRAIYYSLRSTKAAPNKNRLPTDATWWAQVGTLGNTLHSGLQAPMNAIGNVGDYYIDTANNRLFGPKNAVTGWPAGAVDLAGQAGPAGAQGSQGATGPQGAPGPQGATGPQGPKGADGATGATGAQGPAGQSIKASVIHAGAASIDIESGGSDWLDLTGTSLTTNIGESGLAVIFIETLIEGDGRTAVPNNVCSQSVVVKQNSQVKFSPPSIYPEITNQENDLPVDYDFGSATLNRNGSSSARGTRFFVVSGLTEGVAEFSLRYRSGYAGCSWRYTKLMILPQ